MTKKLTIEEMNEIATKKGGKCLSNIYINARTKLKWQCEFGHIWDSTPSNIKRGSWCFKCASNKLKSNIYEMQKIAESRKGKCLSKEYVNSVTKLKWECEFGHTWDSIPRIIKNGGWCPKCSGNQKNTIEDIQALAKSYGGICLSTEYINSKTNLIWQCDKKHRWEDTSHSVKVGKWCPECNKHKKKKSANITLEKMQKIAKERGGKCLSITYINTNTHLEWECANGHTWTAAPSNVKKGTWCPHCNAEIKATRFKDTSLTIEEMKEIAKNRGGICLSKKYENNRVDLKWKCANGHVFYKSANRAKNRNEWCPTCTGFKGEEKCRFILKKLLGAEFRKNRKILGNNLELDGYNEKLNLAFEFNGRQHYMFIKRYHKNEEGFLKQLERDALKKIRCEELKIKLIVIPYDKEEIEKVLIDCIKNELKIFGIPYKQVKIKMDEFYVDSSMFLKLKEIAKSKGGKCLSMHYPGIKDEMKWKCAEGHVWKTKAQHILYNNSWCPTCAGNEKLTIEEMQQIAKERNGECLSTEYINTKEKLKWKCKFGHTWDTSVQSVKGGKWCPYCAGNAKLTIDDCHEIAKSHDGKCLSSQYVNAQRKLKWMCKEGHTWDATLNNIRSGKWCKKCADKKNGDRMRGTLEELRKLAEIKGGNCLSDEYIELKSYYTWECEKGHKWEASGDSIKHGSWCPTCSGKRKLTIDEMKEIAEERNGECLSEVYVNLKTKLTWKCEKGHIWDATPSLIRKGSWCKKCYLESIKK